MSKLTQYQKIVTLMCRYPDRWFFPYDFMGNNLGDLFVGYKAPTRLNELEAEYPELFERQPAGKYIKRRINAQTVKIWFNTLSKDLKQVVAKELDYYPHIPGNSFGQTPKTATLKGFPGIPDGTEVNITQERLL